MVGRIRCVVIIVVIGVSIISRLSAEERYIEFDLRTHVSLEAEEFFLMYKNMPARIPIIHDGHSMARGIVDKRKASIKEVSKGAFYGDSCVSFFDYARRNQGEYTTEDQAKNTARLLKQLWGQCKHSGATGYKQDRVELTRSILRRQKEEFQSSPSFRQLESHIVEYGKRIREDLWGGFSQYLLLSDEEKSKNSPKNLRCSMLLKELEFLLLWGEGDDRIYSDEQLRIAKSWFSRYKC